jgi:hypothetical protein
VQIVSRRHPVRHTVDLAAEIDGDDVGTFFGETYGMRAALAPRGPGDKNDFVFELFRHLYLSVLGLSARWR